VAKFTAANYSFTSFIFTNVNIYRYIILVTLNALSRSFKVNICKQEYEASRGFSVTAELVVIHQQLTDEVIRRRFLGVTNKTMAAVKDRALSIDRLAGSLARSAILPACFIGTLRFSNSSRSRCLVQPANERRN